MPVTPLTAGVAAACLAAFSVFVVVPSSVADSACGSDVVSWSLG